MIEDVIFIGVPRTGTGSMSQLFTLRGIVNPTMARSTPASMVREEVGEDVWEGSYKVAFVRHPIDRFISGMATLRGDVYGSDIVEECVRRNTTIFRRMVEFIDREDLDFIGLYEKIDEEWETLREMIPGLKPLIHINKLPIGRRYTGKRELAKAEEATVRKYYAEDFKQFGYK